MQRFIETFTPTNITKQNVNSYGYYLCFDLISMDLLQCKENAMNHHIYHGLQLLYTVYYDKNLCIFIFFVLGNSNKNEKSLIEDI